MHEQTVYLFGTNREECRALSMQLGRFGSEAWPFTDTSEFVSFLERSQPGTIMIMTGDSPARALQMLDEIRARGVEWPAVIASNSHRIATAVEAMKRGALDFLQLPVDDAILQSALLMANSQLDQLTPAVESRRHAQQQLNRLTPRERDIVDALQRGGLNKVIAHQLGISVRTVEAHRANIMVKLGVRNTAEAIMLIARAGTSIAAKAEPLHGQAISVPGLAPAQTPRPPVAVAIEQGGMLRA